MENLTLNILNVLTIFVSITASAEQIKIAVIDTGYTKPVGISPVNLCKDGHYDASNQTNTVGADEIVNGSFGHGTNIAHIIDDKLKRFGKNRYCIVIFKVYGGSRNLIEMSIDALDKINKSDIKYVNYSTAGEGFDKKESEVVKALLDKGVMIAAAAGNSNVSLESVKIYPAMYDKRINVVGNGFSSYTKSKSSNYGEPVKHWVVGDNICAGGVVKSGTSQATAIFTARMIQDILTYGK